MPYVGPSHSALSSAQKEAVTTKEPVIVLWVQTEKTAFSVSESSSFKFLEENFSAIYSGTNGHLVNTASNTSVNFFKSQ